MGRAGPALAGACLLVVSPLSASGRAHDVGRLARAYASPQLCLDERAVVAEGRRDTGRSSGELFSLANEGGTWCARPAERAAGYLAQRLWVYFRKDSSAQPGLCATSDWVYNPGRTFRFGIYGEPLRPLCGPGLYATRAWAATWVGDRWESNVVDSGWHVVD